MQVFLVLLGLCCALGGVAWAQTTPTMHELAQQGVTTTTGWFVQSLCHPEQQVPQVALGITQHVVTTTENALPVWTTGVTALTPDRGALLQQLRHLDVGQCVRVTPSYTFESIPCPGDVP